MFKQKLAQGLVATAIPVLYMALTHMSWKSTSNGKKRMALQQAGFWGGMLATLGIVHFGVYFKKPPPSQLKPWAICLAASLLPIIGYEISWRLSYKLFPIKRQKRAAAPPITKKRPSLSIVEPPPSLPKPIIIKQPRYYPTPYSPPQASYYPTYANYSTPYPNRLWY